MFENAKEYDKVWSFTKGWGVIADIRKDLNYPIRVIFGKKNTYSSFTLDGRYRISENPDLFWDEIKFEVPKAPVPDLAVDTKVVVRDSSGVKRMRYFSHFVGRIMHCYCDGTTSFSNELGSTTPWGDWELYKKD